MTALLRRNAVTTDQCFAGGGEMGVLMRTHDWSNTTLGPVCDWPPALRTAASICLNSRFPIVLWGGKDLAMLYNDAYRPILGRTKHPGCLGHPARECWGEIWDVIGPMLEGVLESGKATWSEDLLLILDRAIAREETYFTFSYSPIILDDGAIGGIFCACTETTERVVRERRLRTLRDLGARAAEAKWAWSACRAATRTLAQDAADVPFSLFYLVDPDGKNTRLVARTAVKRGSTAAPKTLSLTELDLDAPWPLARIYQTGRGEYLRNLQPRLGPLPGGPWLESSNSALVLPIAASGRHRPIGFFIVGISPRRIYDAECRSFFDLVAVHIGTIIANICAYEGARKRAEALAELDRAKTAFFSNVSHEFRTPLTLILGPAEDAIADIEHPLPPVQRERIETLHRNGLRLLKLVNTLLDFSRIEANRTQAVYESTDLSLLTAELASVFRSAVEHAGLRFTVDCPSLPEPLYIDREMWEKVILNLLSNAFKFTFAGEIGVAVADCGKHAEFSVRDTGVGVPQEELPNLFKRFYQVRGTNARTHEGSGIGLALVQELVKLHGGSVRVKSIEGSGTTFTVLIPYGCAHLPADRIGAIRTSASVSLGARPYVEEALRWLPDNQSEPPACAMAMQAGADGSEAFPIVAAMLPARVLLADDNADMRNYLKRLLSRCWTVDAVADGEEALQSARQNKPDLVLTDVMMPKLDGFGLLRALRADPMLREIPIIMLSARSGEVSRLEGLQAGADDYLIKPFSARELMARVASYLQLKRVREESRAEQKRIREMLQEANRHKDEFLAMLAHELRNPLASIRTGVQVFAMLHSTGSELQKAHKMIDGQVHHLTRLVDDLLDVSRITQRKITICKKRVNLNEAILTAIDSSRYLIDSRHHHLQTDLTALPVIVEGDAIRLAQVFGNLLNNAAKYTEAGGRIIVTAQEEDNEVVVCIKDNGIGLPPEVLPRIFDMFIQADRSLDRSQGGLGIGLSLVKSLVELHGGTVEAYSTGCGQGSEFVVRLPTAPVEIARIIAKPRERVPVNSKHARILVVDDDEDAAESMAMFLRLQGHQSRHVQSGLVALEIAKSFCPQIVLLDIALPGMDGFEVVRQMRKMPETRRSVILALTGYGGAQDHYRSQEAGCDYHLVKPVELDYLKAIIATIELPYGKASDMARPVA